MFQTQTSLHSHLISSAHRRLTVLCPWCFGRERTFTRVHDLEVHVKTAHPAVNVTKENFSRANGFYFSKYPEDYAKIVGKIEPYDSNNAFEARKAVRVWAEGFSDRKVRIDKCNTGWKAGVDVAEGARKSRSRERSTGANRERTVRRQTEDDRGRNQDLDDQERRSRTDTCRQKDSCDTRDRSGDVSRPGERREIYSKSKVGEGDRDTKDSRQDARVDYSDRCVLNSGDNGMEGVVRKDRAVEHERSEDVSRTMKKRETCARKKNGEGDRVEGELDVRAVDDGRGQERNRREDANGNDHGNSGRHEYSKKRVGKGMGVEDVESEDVDTRRMDKMQSKDTTKESRSRKDSAGGNIDKDVVTEKEGEMTRKRDRSSDGDRREAKQLRQEKLDDGFENYSDDIELGEEATERSATRRETSPSPSSSSSSSSSVTLYHGLDDGLRLRAQKILMKGFMPVCPPAKRDWSSIEEFSLESMGITINWPPENWRVMTSDQRLMAHEFIAMFLERTIAKVFPLLSRRALIDKYNFMALEGQGKPQEEENSGDKTDAKIRYYNFSYVKCVALGEVQDTRMSRSLVSSIERASRWSDTDHITQKLDAGGVKIKL